MAETDKRRGLASDPAALATSRGATTGSIAAPPPWWAPLALSCSFLTVLPMPSVAVTPRTLATAIGFFPWVGLILGALLGALGLALDTALPREPVAVALLAIGTALTGGLHLDGLMDTADGVFGGKTATQRLEIMRDSRVGSFGVVAGVVALVGQYACVAQLGGVSRLTALVVALGLSRWAMAVALGVFPSARRDGLGALFRNAGGRWSFALATLIAVGLALATGLFGLLSFGVAIGTVLLGGRFLTARLGGLTGDTYGALAVVVETLVLYLAVAFH